MKYQALYRKYRPKNFDEVAGQQVTMKILKNSILKDHISHAYLFYGPRGTGKTSIAKILSRTVNCEKNNNLVPCEECDNCKYSISSSCPDIIEIDAASNNGVDEIRELKNKISFSPTKLKYKVYIIDEVHMLSTGAFNALLKTLEEPPEYAIFILATTELQKVPLTILSRCQTLEFKKIDDESMFNKLKEISNNEKINITDEGIKEIVNNSNGGLRDAIGLLEKANSYKKEIDDNVIREISGNIPKEELNKFVDMINNNQMDDLLKKINDYYNDGIDLIKLSNNIINYLRNEMVSAKKYNKEYCDLILDLDNISTKMEKSQNPKILFEVTIINHISSKTTVVEENKEIVKNEIKQTNVQNNNENNNDIEELKKIENLKSIRISNTLYNPQKSIISTIRNDWNNIKEYAFDEEYGNIARILSSDVMPVAASDTNLILITKLNGIANQINKDYNNFEQLINKVFNNKYKIICLSEDEWKNCTNEYKNNKEKFKYQEENSVEKKDNNSLAEKAKELFGD